VGLYSPDYLADDNGIVIAPSLLIGTLPLPPGTPLDKRKSKSPLPFLSVKTRLDELL
jgi:hypothetical protein